jgi:puromycin-sensitive aminopeptidase
VVNAGGHGFYRVAYAPELLQALRDHLQELAPVERALLLDDTWAAVLAGRVGAADYLDLARGYRGETDRTVWATLASGLAALDRLLDGEDRERFQAVVRDLVRPTFERLGWAPREGEDQLTRQLRGTLIVTLGTLGADPEVRAKARELHGTYVADTSSVEANVAAAVVNVVASVGTEADHDLFWDRYRTSQSPQESLRYLYALSNFPDPALARKILDLTLTNEIRSQNAPSSVLLLLANRDVNQVAWAFVRDEWDRLNERFPDNAIPRMLQGITTLSTPDLAAEVEAFVTAHPVPHGQRMVDQHLERLRVNVALREREAARVAAHLS